MQDLAIGRTGQVIAPGTRGRFGTAAECLGIVEAGRGDQAPAAIPEVNIRRVSISLSLPWPRVWHSAHGAPSSVSVVRRRTRLDRSVRPACAERLPLFAHVGLGLRMRAPATQVRDQRLRRRPKSATCPPGARRRSPFLDGPGNGGPRSLAMGLRHWISDPQMSDTSKRFDWHARSGRCAGSGEDASANGGGRPRFLSARDDAGSGPLLQDGRLARTAALRDLRSPTL